MKKQPIMFGDERMSSTLSSAILARTYKPKELKDIWDAYKRARMKDRETKPPTEIQKKMAQMKKEGFRTKDIAAKFKVKTTIVDFAVRKVAIEMFLTGE